MIRLRITSESQIVNMDDVYDVYGKENGSVRTDVNDFVNEAKKCLESIIDDDIIRVGNLGTRALFEKIIDELDCFGKTVKNFKYKRREYYTNLCERQKSAYDDYLYNKQLEEAQKNNYV